MGSLALPVELSARGLRAPPSAGLAVVLLCCEAGCCAPLAFGAGAVEGLGLIFAAVPGAVFGPSTTTLSPDLLPRLSPTLSAVDCAIVTPLNFSGVAALHDVHIGALGTALDRRGGTITRFPFTSASRCTFKNWFGNKVLRSLLKTDFSL